MKPSAIFDIKEKQNSVETRHKMVIYDIGLMDEISFFISS